MSKIVCFKGVLVSLKELPLRAKEASILLEKGDSCPYEESNAGPSLITP